MFKTLQTRFIAWYGRGKPMDWIDYTGEPLEWDDHKRSPSWKVHRLLTWLGIRR